MSSHQRWTYDSSSVQTGESNGYEPCVNSASQILGLLTNLHIQ